MEVIPKIIFYIDEDYCCHVDPGEGRREMSSNFFVGKEFEIEHYRFIPVGEAWISKDGNIFYGEMVSLI